MMKKCSISRKKEEKATRLKKEANKRHQNWIEASGILKMIV